MGWNIYTQSYKDKQGKSKITYRITSPHGQYFKNLPIKVKPSDFDKKKARVNATAENATAINAKLAETTTLLNEGWSLYEAGTYNWDELLAFLGGSRPENDLQGFCHTVLRDSETEQMYKGIKDALGAAKKVLGRDLTFDDINEATYNKIILNWKSRLRAASVKTYRYHLGYIAQQAYKKKLTSYKFEILKKWQTKRDKTTIEGNPYVTTVRPENFKDAINRCENMMHIVGLGFWLYSFCMRGMYATDLNSLHKADVTLHLDEKESGWGALIHHYRHKSNEPMFIHTPTFLSDLQYRLRGYLEITHGYKINTKTGKAYLRTEQYILAETEQEGWFFKEYNKDIWGTISKQCVKVGLKPLKTARKTFETVAQTQEIRKEISDRLLGHTVQGVKRHYQDWEWDELQDQIFKAHEKVLAAYEVDKLLPALYNKANTILANKGINVELFNLTNSCSSKEYV